MSPPYHSRTASLMWSSVSKACSSSPIAVGHSERCDVFSAAQVGWPSQCGALSATPPYLVALTDAVVRHLGAEADSMARAPYALSDAVELHGLVASAGFRNVHVRPAIKTTKL